MKVVSLLQNMSADPSSFQPREVNRQHRFITHYTPSLKSKLYQNSSKFKGIRLYKITGENRNDNVA